MNWFNNMHLDSENSVNNDTAMNLQFKFFRERLDSLEKRMQSNKKSGSTFETNQMMQHFDPRNRTERIESLRLSFLSDHPREAEDPFSFESIAKQKIKILDFSPEWDYTSGGAKLLVCFKPDLQRLMAHDTGVDVYDAIESRFALRFGETEVPIKFIQNGVFKCHAPPNPTGYVELDLLYDGESILQKTKENSHLFQYRENQQSRKKVYVRMRDHNSSLLDSEPREFKVRLIETLSGLERDLSSFSNQGTSNNQAQSEKVTVNFDQLKHLDIKILEKINRSYFIRVTRLVFNKMRVIYGKERSSRVLNRRDKDGFSIIHYVVCLDYFELIPDLHSLGADLSLPTWMPGKQKENMIPIVIWSAKGYQKTLNALLQYVAIPYNADEKEVRLNWTKSILEDERENRPDNLNHSENSDSDEEDKSEGPLEAAFNNKQHEILEILLRDMTLQKALKTDNSSEVDEMEPNHIKLLKSFYESERLDHSPTLMAKGRIRELLSTNTFKAEAAPGPRDDTKRLRFDDRNERGNVSDESVDDDVYFIKNSEGYKIEVITDEMKASNLCPISDTNRNKLLSGDIDDSAAFNNKARIKKSSSSNTKQMDSLVESNNDDTTSKKSLRKVNRISNLKEWVKDLKLVEKIQRNVKRWLLKRQACDISHASDVIQKELNKNMLKKSGHTGINKEDAIVLIQRAARNWLADKC